MKKADIHEFRRNLRQIEREVDRQLKTETDCCGVTLAQCHALIELGESGPTTLVSLAQRLGLDASTLSRTVDQLVNLKLVKRETNPSNRRSISLSLTPQGRAKVSRLNEDCDKYYGNILATWPAEKRALLIDGIRLLAEFFLKRPGETCISLHKAGFNSKSTRKSNNCRCFLGIIK